MRAARPGVRAAARSRRSSTFPYHPHVTVAHHLDEAALDHAYEALADYDCAFEVDAFHLYVHGDDGVWRPSATFALGG